MHIKIELEPVEGYKDIIQAIWKIQDQMMENILMPRNKIKNQGRLKNGGRWEVTHCAIGR